VPEPPQTNHPPPGARPELRRIPLRHPVRPRSGPGVRQGGDRLRRRQRSGKSTLIEAIAEACALPIWGGSRNEAANPHGPDQRAALGSALRFAFSRRPRDGYFFRAELQSNFASLLDERRDDPDFQGDPYARYGGRSLRRSSPSC